MNVGGRDREVEGKITTTTKRGSHGEPLKIQRERGREPGRHKKP